MGGCIALHFAAQRHPDLAVLLYLIMFSVEIVAHGFVMYYAEVRNVHQKLLGHKFSIVKWYLDSKPMLFWACASFEICTIGLVVNSPWLYIAGMPGLIFRSLANLTRLYAC